jgi:hypothetical protein
VFLHVFDRLQTILQFCHLLLYLLVFLSCQRHIWEQSQYVIVRPSRVFNVVTHRIRLATYCLIEVPTGGC